MKIGFTVCLLVILSGCIAAKPIQALGGGGREVLKDSTVSESEASTIGARFIRISCGYTGKPVDEGEMWRVAIYEGLAPTHTRDVLVYKVTKACEVVEIVAKR